MPADPHCHCEPAPRGPPWDDGAEAGPCAYCEEQQWQAAWGQRDEDFEAMLDGSATLTADDLEGSQL